LRVGRAQKNKKKRSPPRTTPISFNLAPFKFPNASSVPRDCR
jgi:hypothetical protein